MAEKKTGHLVATSESGQNLTDSVSNPVSNSVSNWEPTPKQSALLAAAGEIGLGLTITAVCKKAGVSRERFYQSMKQPGFVARWNELARQIVQTAVPGAASAMGQKAAEGDTASARLIFQAGGVIGSGGVNLHFGDNVTQQLNVQGNQPPYGDHRDLVFRAQNMKEFEIVKKVTDKVVDEVAAAEAKGDPVLTGYEQLLAIKLSTERLIADADVIDVEAVEVAEAGDDVVAAPTGEAGV